MSRLLAKLLGFFSSRTLVGVDKAGNRYFTRKEEVDGISLMSSLSRLPCAILRKTYVLTVKEKRRVIFKGEEDPTSIPVEWICWLNGQRKSAPTPEEMAELKAKRERIRQNVALLKKEEEEKKLANAAHQPSRIIGKDASPDLKSFIKQFPGDRGSEEASVAVGDESEERTSEPTGSGESFKPGTWQPPT